MLGWVMSLYLVAYDIASDRRRRQVARVLRRYGWRLQRSVFELRMLPDDLVELRRQVGPLLASEDAFDIFPIDERGARGRIRWMREPATCRPVLLC